MKILFAVSNENIAEAIKKEYQNNYKSQLITKNVYYFNAIIKELQNNKTYDVVIVSEDLEPFANNNYDTIDKFLSDKLVTIREEAINSEGNRVPIIFITTDRHMFGDFLTTKLYEIGIYNALVGTDRSIENVCTLMFHPRNKQEAKAYYRVNAEIDRGPREDDVKEEEIKNIILHYKKLGKAEERYVESFDNIASQYNDAQLKVIIRFLPLNVKAVLEAQSPKYQSLTTFANNYNTGAVTTVPQIEKSNQIKEKNITVNSDNNRVLEQISSVQNTSDVIIPNAMNINRVRKIDNDNNTKNEISEAQFSTDIKSAKKSDDAFDNVLPGIEEDNNLDNNNQEEVMPTVKRGRGRPRKNVENVTIPQGTKRGRGRPRKNVVLEQNTENNNDVSYVLPGFEEGTQLVEESQDNVLPGFEKEFGTAPDDILPGLEEKTEIEKETQNNILPGFEEKKEFAKRKQDNILPGVDNNIKETQETVLPGVNDDVDDLNSSIKNDTTNDSGNNIQTRSERFANPIENIQMTNNMLEKKSVRYENIEYLIPADKRIAIFFGTSKSGVSFIVNNLAQMLTSFNINVAILDLTKNKNSFYIYTNNDESLRNKASNSIYNLLEGNAEGIKVNKNLTIYTSLPTDTEEFYEADKVLKTLLDNHSVILIDADYDTPIGYFDNSTDLFMVQNMDILTMQPLTTFLKELKAKNVLKDEKLRLIVNMEAKVRGINSQVLLSALSVYKDPGMAYTVDLYNKETVKLFTVPFDMDAYNKYLTTLVECNLSLTGYSKLILSSLKEIAVCIYPLLSVGKGKKNTSYSPPSLNNYTSTPFNGEMNSTLSQMKNRY